MAEVYWIHSSDHTDMFSQGYIGVTSKTAQERYAEHIRASRVVNSKSSYLYNVMRKVGPENLIVKTILISDEEYAYDIENKLRPTKSIGWNISIGGSKPPSKLGFKHSDESKEKISKIWKGKTRSKESVERSSATRAGFRHSEETKEQFRLNNLGKKQSQETIDKRLEKVRGQTRTEEEKIKMSEARLNILPWFRKPTPYAAWSLAEEVRVLWESGLSAYKIGKKYDISASVVRSMFKLFVSNWVPTNDERWLSEFKQQEA